MFMVDTPLPGIEVRKIETLGQRAIGTTQVFYTDVEMPADCVIGAVDDGRFVLRGINGRDRGQIDNG